MGNDSAAYEDGEQLDMAMTERDDLLRVARRLRAALANSPSYVRYDTHGWFVCDWCGASAMAYRTDKGMICDPPFAHTPDCGLPERERLLADPAVQALGEDP